MVFTRWLVTVMLARVDETVRSTMLIAVAAAAAMMPAMAIVTMASMSVNAFAKQRPFASQRGDERTFGAFVEAFASTLSALVLIIGGAPARCRARQLALSSGQ